MSRLNFSLLENSLDYLNRSIRYAQEDADQSDWKYALLHLASSLELLMKEILRREHWSLLFQKIDEASKDLLAKGSFKSVDAETAIKRLEGIAGFELADDERAFLRNLRDRRNRIQHLDVDIRVQELKANVAKGLAIYCGVCERLDALDLMDVPREITSKLREFEKFVQERMKLIRPTLDDSERPSRHFRECHVCWQDAIVFRDDLVVCLFCGNETEEISDHVEHSCEGVMGACPECEEGCLGLILYNNDDGELFCAKCGYRTDRSYWTGCLRCGRAFWQEDEDDVEVCPDCCEHVTSAD